MVPGLVIFCRRPALGSGKQRLARAIGPEKALAIATALLDCALEDARVWPHEVILSPASLEDAGWARELLDRPVLVAPQPEGNLGERLNAVDATLRARGFRKLLFIGTDAPSMTVDDLQAACDALAHCDVVLAPATDGGVTLMGSRVPWPVLADLPWSQQQLGAALQARCVEQHLTVTRLRTSYDVDEIDDLWIAKDSLVLDSRPARQRLREQLAATLRDRDAGE
jgi:rSAM/selenodomain-associated transferase 1